MIRGKLDRVPVRGGSRAALAALLLVGGLLAGCGGGNDDEAGGNATSPSSSSPAAPSASSSASSSPDGDGHGGDGHDGDGGTAHPPFPADTRPDTQQASAGAFGNVTAIRIGHHDGYDSVVLEYGGRGTPGWDVRYVDHPAAQGSGAAIDLAGSATLQMTISGVGYPTDTGVQEYSGPRRFSVPETDIVTEVYFDGTFEGTTVVLVGTGSATPFRVYQLENPVRVVLEVADA